MASAEVTPPRRDTDGPTRDLVVRLRRVEGQVRGLQRLLEEGRSCSDVLTQYLAARAALEEVGTRLVDGEIARCLDSGTAVEVEQLRETLRMLLKVRR
ncbi:MAG: metal-sensitive transcriptional regulator [Anaerolineae bacterium]|nr:metal-sensitive transcriptional regulator [Anaerolineae bacterium]